MHLPDQSAPMIMGILNTTPDSFFDGGRYALLDDALRRAERLISEGAHIIDVGGASSRPGARPVPEADERQRTAPLIAALHARFPETTLSIDTWRAPVARAAVEAGARMVNDISGGELDPSLYPTLAELNRQTPIHYVLMHMQGTPETMQRNPQYDDIVTEVMDFFIQKLKVLKEFGLYDVILDPGFGFGKTVEHNYTLLRRLSDFKTVLERPILAGLSRKSMICKVLGVLPEDALNGTTALHMVALQQGARILRVHDVKEAAEVVELWISVVGSR
ncbi:MAG: dihydropteroate synthase [Saprospiraceae bacterium]|nr:dihydropteroate synthase [Saprospiraceae bacterium]